MGALGGGGQAELHGGREILQNAAPVALIVCPAAVAFIDDDEVEEIWGVVAKVRRRGAVGSTAGHEGLEDGEEDAAVLWDAPVLADHIGIDTDQGVIREGGEIEEGLIRQNIAVRKEQDTGPALAVFGQGPAAVEQFPGNLEGDAGFAGPGRHGEQDAVLAGGDGFECCVDGVVLVIARLPGPALGFEGDCGEAVAPGVVFGEGSPPRVHPGWGTG